MSVNSCVAETATHQMSKQKERGVRKNREGLKKFRKDHQFSSKHVVKVGKFLVQLVMCLNVMREA